MAETEKITINMNVVDLGKVDLLVDQGFYSNRTEFIKSSIRHQLMSHAKDVDHVITQKSYVLGVTHYSRQDLEKVLDENKILDIKVVGLLMFDEDIDDEILIKTIKSVNIFGVLKATNELKSAIKSL